MEQVVLEGQKGGDKKAHQPVEERNNLLSKSYAKVLLAIGEGEFAGTPTAQDIYLDGTPLVSATGLQNFGGVKWDYRPGRSDQSHIPGMPDISNEFAIGLALTSATPYTRLITNSQLDAIRITLAWPALYQQKDNGDIVGYNIVYAIDISTNGGAYVQQGQWDTGTGKTNVEYNRTHRLTLPKPGTSWTFRVRRITTNQNNAKFADIMQVKSYAEVIDAKLRYPNTALLYVEFDAEAFGGSSIPKVSVRTKGRLIQVPQNYDPTTRAYSGVWNGTFKWAWSDNPAWVFYDLVTNDRYGLGARITPALVDKWTLYQVAQYCDVIVPNGKGGTEPRYTCNVYIQARREAWQVLRDIVGIFNGMLHWSGTQMVASADMPVAINTVRTYNRSNVVDGKFVYGSTSEKTIATTALVSFDDPDNHFETAVEAVNELSLVQRYKTWNQAELAAIGCTSRGQAQRKGKYTMITNSLNRVVTFKLGLEGYLPRPGDVIGVADQVLAGSQFSGRISTATLKIVTCDRVPNAVAGDILYINKADGTLGEGRTIQSVAGKAITVTTNYSEIPAAELGWYVEKTTLKSQLFRVTKVGWSDNDGKFEVTGVQYEDSKYGAVDIGARLESRPITIVPAGGQDAPTGLTLTSFSYIEQTMAVTTLSVKWNPAAGAMKYEGQWRKDGGEWNNVGLTASTGFDVKGIYSGAYQARVRAINALGTKSIWLESANTQLNGKVGNPPSLATLTTVSEIFGIRINWTFSPGAEDGNYIQLQQATNDAGAGATDLTMVSYPAQTYLKSNMLGGAQLYFRGRLIDRTGNQSPWTAWTYGISEYGTDKILEAILGEIERTELGQELLSELDTTKQDINWLESEVTGLEQQVQNNLSDLNDTISDVNIILDELNDQLDAAFSTPEYDATKTYAKGDITRVGERLYQAIIDVPVNTTPPNVTYWLDVGQVVSNVSGLAAQVQLNTANVATLDGVTTAQAGQITGVKATLDGISGSGTNLMPAEYSVFSANKPDIVYGSTIATTVADATALNGYALKVTTNSTTNTATIYTAPLETYAAFNMACKPGKYILSYYAKTETAGHTIALFLRGRNSADVAASSAGAAQDALTTGWVRYSQVVDLTGASFADKDKMTVGIQVNRSGVTGRVFYLDRIMLEPQIADGVAPSPFSVGNSFGKVDGLATATTALTATVSQNGTDITNQGLAITNVQATLNGQGGAGTNLLNDTYSWLTSTTLPPLAVNTGLTAVGVAVAGSASGFGVQTTTSSTSSGLYVEFTASNNAAGWNIPVEAGTYLVSAYLSSPTAGASCRVSLYDGTARYSPAQALTTTRTRYTFPVVVAGPTTVGTVFYPNMGAASGTVVIIDSVMVEKRMGSSNIASPFVAGSSAAAVAATASATSALAGTVSQQGTTVDAHTNNLTTLNSTVNSLGGSGTNLVPAEYSAFTSKVPTFSKAALLTVATEADSTAYSGYTLRATNTTATVGHLYLSATAGDYNLRISPDKKYIISFWARGDVAHNVGIRIRYPNSAGTAVEVGLTSVAITTTMTRYSAVLTMPAAVVDRGVIVLYTQNTAAIGDTWFDGFMFEPAIGPATTPSAFVPGNAMTQIIGQASATSALDTRVTLAEGNITSTGGAITTINSNIGKIGAAGSNLLNDDYSWLTSTTLPANVSGSSLARVGIAVPGSPSGFGIKMTTASTSTGQFIMLSPTNNAAGWNVDLEAGTYLVSMYVQGSVAGTMRVSMYDGTHRYSPNVAFTTTRTRLTFVCVATAYARAAVTIYPNMSALAAGTEITIDSVMVEKAASDLTSQVPSPFVAGSSARALSALATATNAMGTTVSQHGTDITTASNNILSLTAKIDGVAQENYVVDPTYNVDKSSLTNSAQVTIVPQTDVSVPAGSSVPRLAKWDVPTSTGNTYLGWQCTTLQRSPANTLTAAMAPGEVYEVSCDVWMDVAGAARQHGIWFQFYDAANASISHNWVPGTISTKNGQWETIAGTVTVPATVVRGRPTFRMSAGDATPLWITNLRWTKQTAAQAGTAAALSAMSTTVDSLDGKITSTAQELRSLNATARPSDGSGDLADALNLWNSNAKIQSESIARATEDGAMATRVETLSAQVNNATAMIQTEATARADADSANATYTQTVQASLNNTNATVQTNANTLTTLNGKVSAAYSIKLGVSTDGRYYAAGMGIGIENTPAGMQSQVLFLADRFAVMNTANGATATPFVIQNGQVIINNALIGTAAITNAMIADAQITYAKIGAAQIADTHIINGHITNAKIQDGAITNAKIGDAQITTAKIGALQVDSLRIANNAVTIPYYAQIGATGSATAAVYYPQIVHLVVIAAVHRSSKYAGGSAIYISLWNSAGQLVARSVGGYTNGFSYGGDYWSTSSIATVSWYLNAGTYYVTIESDGQSSAGVTILGAMK
ncbi:Carbohydrate binding domain protein [compost metagenome]